MASPSASASASQPDPAMATSELFKSLNNMTAIDLKILGKITKASNMADKFKK